MSSKIGLTKAGVFVIVFFVAVFSFVGARRYYRITYPSFKYVPNDISVTIPEGSNIAEIDKILDFAGVASQGSFLTSEYLKMEGTFFPDTYRFDRGSSKEKIYSVFENNFKKKIADLNIDESTLVIASMLEKEVQTEEDMRIVAGIIKKRLDAGMLLQIDATVAYGACVPTFLKGKYCDVSKVNIVDNIPKDSAYNTYKRIGLPKGPISNPGMKAIRATIDPVETKYWFYLSAKDGKTIFSETLEQHNAARRKYL